MVQDHRPAQRLSIDELKEVQARDENAADSDVLESEFRKVGSQSRGGRHLESEGCGGRSGIEDVDDTCPLVGEGERRIDHAEAFEGCLEGLGADV